MKQNFLSLMYTPVYVLMSHGRGSSFLKKWMDFLEENADLRYADLASVTAG